MGPDREEYNELRPMTLLYESEMRQRLFIGGERALNDARLLSKAGVVRRLSVAPAVAVVQLPGFKDRGPRLSRARWQFRSRGFEPALDALCSLGFGLCGFPGDGHICQLIPRLLREAGQEGTAPGQELDKAPGWHR